jgi:pimeloyl-ACP methyl ester carboxylesterase
LEGTGSLFTAFVQALGPGVETLVVSYPVDVALGYADLESFVRKRLPTNRPFVVLGESFSGPIAVRIGAEPPPGLVGIILCVTFARSPSPALKWVAMLGPLLPMKNSPRWMLGHALWGAYEVPGIADQVEAAIDRVDAAVLQHRMTEMADVDASAALARIAVPILVMQAAADLLVPAGAVDHVLRTQPRARHVVVEGPHLLLQTKPQECATIVREFLTSV